VIEEPLFEFQVVLKESVSTPGQWEFVHPGEDTAGNSYPNYTSKLPANDFPITHLVKPNGIIVNCNNEVKGAFHRYQRSRFGGPHFYIGSPYQQLRGNTAQQWRAFVSKFGATSGKISVHKLQIFPNYLCVFS
jgi:hypothetical protein